MKTKSYIHYSVWMVTGAFMFAAMGLSAKMASVTYSSDEMIFYRGIVSMLIMLPLLKQQKISIRTNIIGKHAWRSFVGGTALLCNFYAISQLPLATAMTLSYMSSLWVGIFVFSASIIRHLLQRKSLANFPLGIILILILSFTGVILLLQPTIESNQINAGIIGLIAGMLAALAYIQVSHISKTGEPTLRIVFYFSIGCVLIGGLAMLVNRQFNWNWQQAVWLIPIGVFACLGQICLTKAYSLAKTQTAMLTVANLQYMGIVFSAIFGTVFFQDQIHWLGWIGMAIIIFSGVLSTYTKRRTS